MVADGILGPFLTIFLNIGRFETILQLGAADQAAWSRMIKFVQKRLFIKVLRPMPRSFYNFDGRPRLIRPF